MTAYALQMLGLYAGLKARLAKQRLERLQSSEGA